MQKNPFLLRLGQWTGFRRPAHTFGVTRRTQSSAEAGLEGAACVSMMPTVAGALRDSAPYVQGARRRGARFVRAIGRFSLSRRCSRKRIDRVQD
jgi:hypothetical protein